MTDAGAKRYQGLKGTRYIDPRRVMTATVAGISAEAEAVYGAVGAFMDWSLFTEDERTGLATDLRRAVGIFTNLLADVTGEGGSRLGRRCDHCETVFDASRADARFCSQTCRQAAYRHRKGN